MATYESAIEEMVRRDAESEKEFEKRGTFGVVLWARETHPDLIAEANEYLGEFALLLMTLKMGFPVPMAAVKGTVNAYFRFGQRMQDIFLTSTTAKQRAEYAARENAQMDSHKNSRKAKWN
jgi:hypothetical protein